MPNYWLTFRIEENATYQKRYNDFINEIRSFDLVWEEPTSFMFVESGVEIDPFVTRISQHLDHTKDLLLVRYVSKKVSRVFGKVEEPDILRFFLS